MSRGLPSVIAIDGPGASGKSTVGLLLAQRLGYTYVDTGTMYRALTWLALSRGVDLRDEQRIVDLALSGSIRIVPGDQENPAGRTFIDGHDVSAALHTPAVDASVSIVSQIPEVRTILVEQQRQLAAQGRVVMVGRDIGTVVLPDAGLKVFLDASREERARRRLKDLQTENPEMGFDAVLEALRKRDALDESRAASPLRPAPDARVLSTDGLTPEQVVSAILEG